MSEYCRFMDLERYISCFSVGLFRCRILPMVKVDDLNVYYEFHGEGEPLLLISGLSVDITSIVLVIDRLSKKYRVLFQITQIMSNRRIDN